MKVKVLVANVTVKTNHPFQQEMYGLNATNISDRRKTINILKKIENGNWWQDLAWDYVYEKRIVPRNIMLKSEKQMIDFLLKTEDKKFESFVRVFATAGNGQTICKVKEIEV